MTTRKIMTLLVGLCLVAFTACKKNNYEQVLAQASQIDNAICGYAQTLFGDIDENSGITVDAVSPGTAFTSTKATVDGSTKTAIPVYRISQGKSGWIFGKETINTTVWCKTRTPAAIKWNTGINYTEQDEAAGTCREVNQYVYDKTLDLLTDAQKERYNAKGKKIVFSDDTVVGEGIQFYALDQYGLIEDTGTQLNISAASLESPFGDSPEDDRRGAKYCKIIASQNLLAWMLDGAFKCNGSLTKTDDSLVTCEDVHNAIGSCYFINEHSKTYMCEDYIGPVYRDTTLAEYTDPQAKCTDKRGGTYVEGVVCADRTDIDGTISGICAINETEDGAYTWTLYEPEGADECPLRFFTCDN